MVYFRESENWIATRLSPKTLWMLASTQKADSLDLHCKNDLSELS